jgi:hypothetical protein
MKYLKCKSCGGYYELEPEEAPEDFEICQCGGKLEFYDDRRFENEHDAYHREIKDSKSESPLKILIAFLVLLFITFGSGIAMIIILFGLQYLGPSNGNYLFMLYFGICFASILVLLWYLFRKR